MGRLNKEDMVKKIHDAKDDDLRSVVLSLLSEVVAYEQEHLKERSTQGVVSGVLTGILEALTNSSQQASKPKKPKSFWEHIFGSKDNSAEVAESRISLVTSNLEQLVELYQAMPANFSYMIDSHISHLKVSNSSQASSLRKVTEGELSKFVKIAYQLLPGDKGLECVYEQLSTDDKTRLRLAIINYDGCAGEVCLATPYFAEQCIKHYSPDSDNNLANTLKFLSERVPALSGNEPSTFVDEWTKSINEVFHHVAAKVNVLEDQKLRAKYLSQLAQAIDRCQDRLLCKVSSSQSSSEGVVQLKTLSKKFVNYAPVDGNSKLREDFDETASTTSKVSRSTQRSTSSRMSVTKTGVVAELTLPPHFEIGNQFALSGDEARLAFGAPELFVFLTLPQLDQYIFPTYVLFARYLTFSCFIAQLKNVDRQVGDVEEGAKTRMSLLDRFLKESLCRNDEDNQTVLTADEFFQLVRVASETDNEASEEQRIRNKLRAIEIVASSCKIILKSTKEVVGNETVTIPAISHMEKFAENLEELVPKEHLPLVYMLLSKSMVIRESLKNIKPVKKETSASNEEIANDTFNEEIKRRRKLYARFVRTLQYSGELLGARKETSSIPCLVNDYSQVFQRNESYAAAVNELLGAQYSDDQHAAEGCANELFELLQTVVFPSSDEKTFIQNGDNFERKDIVYSPNESDNTVWNEASLREALDKRFFCLLKWAQSRIGTTGDKDVDVALAQVDLARKRERFSSAVIKGETGVGKIRFQPTYFFRQDLELDDSKEFAPKINNMRYRALAEEDRGHIFAFYKGGESSAPAVSNQGTIVTNGKREVLGSTPAK